MSASNKSLKNSIVFFVSSLYLLKKKKSPDTIITGNVNKSKESLK